MEEYFFKLVDIPSSFTKPLPEHMVNINNINQLHTTYNMNVDRFPKDLRNFVNSIGLQIRSVHASIMAPGIHIPPHTDGDRDSFVRLNFVFGGEDSVVQFLKPKVDILTETKTNNKPTRKSISQDQCDVLHSHKGPYVALFDCGHTLHSITTYKEYRWLYLFQLIQKSSRLSLTQETAMIYFKDYLKAS
jgi:hypothetical protein